MSKIRFSEDHEYIRLEDGAGTVGITPFAQEQLGDIVFVELPEVGTTVKKGDEVAVVESVKAASEIYAPVSGTVTAINDALNGEPGLVNTDPLGAGWMFKLDVTAEADLDELLDEDGYAKHTS
jgi:glycine cleavage system H protein